ncbi:16S rRNA (cytidine(1402)-2'-O)-methyltransferase [bacterium]|nr:16S rRNA (cytidine(1402)-2'-O)-methyltransferase [bacterium]
MGNWTPNPAALVPGLHFVATPIGAARDITLRALDILARADVLAAEDTRTLRHLMEIHGVALNGRPVLAYHDHNGDQMRPRLLEALKAGKSVAYASEAGTPLVADPGYQLARAAIDAGLTVLAAPGPSALLCALSVSGLPTDRFFFAGFLPNKSIARRSTLRDLAQVPGSLIFYESPRRIEACLRDMIESLGGDRQAALCRELTKRFEEVTRGSLAELAQSVAGRDIKGEIVVVVDRAHPVAANAATVEEALRQALKTLSKKDAATQVSEAFGLPRREVYQLALSLGADTQGDDA